MVITFEATIGGARRVSEHRSMRDASASLPDGAYTTFRTYSRTRVLRLGQHLRRLEDSAALMGLGAAPIDDRVARGAIGATLGPSPASESRFRLTYAPPRLFISVEPFAPYPEALYQVGVRCVTVPLHRDNPHAKSTTFIASAADAYAALPAGVHEGLMVAEDGCVLEGLSSNFFAIAPAPGLGVALRTEEARVLIGVTRSLVLEIAHGVLRLSTEAVRQGELAVVRECFITSVSREIMPVVEIDQRAIGDGRPGPITRELMARFRALVDREAEAVL